jgi:hypothetical protein
MEPIECSETSDISTQTPGKHPKENILHLTHGESSKSRNNKCNYVLSEENYVLSTNVPWQDNRYLVQANQARKHEQILLYYSEEHTE